MVVGKVSNQLHEQFDVCHLVQQILILEMLWLHIADGLGVSACALAKLAHNVVLHHVTLLALEILQLVRDKSSVHKIEKSSLNVELVKILFAIFTCPVSSDDMFGHGKVLVLFKHAFLVE